jgi:hypothetical protein
MLRDGLYRLTYPIDARGTRETALAMVRDGVLFGSDPYGGVYQGATISIEGHASYRITLTGIVPPGGELITGEIAGEDGAAFDLSGIFDPTADHQTIRVQIGDATVQVEVQYLGPLPN